MDKRPRSVVSPSGLRPFLAVSQNAFRPGDPRNGPKSRFFFSDPIIIWEKGNLGALGSAGVSLLLCETSISARWGPKNGPFRATGGKNRIDGCDGTEISVVLPLGIIRIDKKNGPLRPLFRRKSVFTRRRVRVGGAGGTKVPFRCNSLRQSAPAGQVFFTQPGDNLCGFYHTCVLFHTYVWKSPHIWVVFPRTGKRSEICHKSFSLELFCDQTV